LCDFRPYWVSTTETGDKHWDVAKAEWKSVRVPTEALRGGVVFDIGQWLKRLFWTRYLTVDGDGYGILEIPEEGELFREPLKLWDSYHTRLGSCSYSMTFSQVGVGVGTTRYSFARGSSATTYPTSHLTIFSVKTKNPRTDDPLANEYRAGQRRLAGMSLNGWKILNGRGKNFGFGVGLVPW
jgi:hypothetical protein